MAEEVPEKLVFGAGHAEEGKVVEIPLTNPYILAFDTRTYKAWDMKVFSADTDRTIVAAAFLNTLDDYLAMYTSGVQSLLAASKAVRDKQLFAEPGYAGLDPQSAMGLVSQAQMKYEESAPRIVEAGIDTKVSVILPLCRIVTGNNKFIKDDQINLMLSSPAQRSIVFVMWTGT